MATLAELRAELSAVLRLDNQVSGDQTYMDLWINEGVADVLLRTRCKVLPFEMDTTAGEGDYTLSDEIMSIIELSITSSANDYHVERMTPGEIIHLRRNTSESSPSRAYAVAGADLLMLYPIPDAVDTITGLYVPRPETLSNDNDRPTEIPAEWHRLVAFYALARAADMDDDSSSEQGERYRGLYQQGCAAFRRTISSKGGRPARARVNHRSRRLVPHDPSTDW